MALDRKDPYSAIPLLEKKIKDLETKEEPNSDKELSHLRKSIFTLRTATDLKVNELTATKADIDQLHATNAEIDNLKAGYAEINTLVADKADIKDLNATNANIDTLNANKANIDLANVNNAWIENGVIKDASIGNEKVISVSANKLTAGTIDASEINVLNLNASNITTGTINGQRIGNESITLDKLAEEVPTKEYLDSVKEQLQGEIDGAIETFTTTTIPLLSNYPANSWTTAEERAKHVGDICYVVNNESDEDGFCYRFQFDGTTYKWSLIKDADVTKALKDVADLGGTVTAFKTEYGVFKKDTNDGIEQLGIKQTTLETSLGNKVEKSVFNELKGTVDGNSATITTLSETVSGKADSSTVTTLSNTVNEVKQTSEGNSASISTLTSTTDSLGTRLATAESSINQTAEALTSTVKKDQLISSINQSAESVTINANKVNLNGYLTVSSADSKYDTKGSASTAETNAVASVKSFYATESDTTTIDGSHIIAGTIDANRLNVNEAIATTLTTGKIYANQITVASNTLENKLSTMDTSIGTANTNASNAVSKVDNLQIGGRNLAKEANIQSTGTTYTKSGNTYTMMCGNNAGIKFPADMFEEDQKYVLSFKFQKLNSVALTSMAGHCQMFQTYKIVINGSIITQNSQNWSPAHAIADSSAVQTCEVYLRRYKESEATTTDKNLYIQPQRGNYHSSNDIQIKFWDIQIEKGDKATSYTPAPEDVQQYTDNKVNNLEIGGVNLIRDTGDLTKWRLNNTQAEGNQAIISHGSSQAWNYTMQSSKLKYSDIKNRTVTVSMFVKSDATSNVGLLIFSLGRTNTTSGNYLRTGYIDLRREQVTNLNTEWEKIIVTKLITDNSFTYESSGGDYLYMQITNYSLCNIYVKDIQMEYGDKATDWSPSPEDVQANIDSKYDASNPNGYTDDTKATQVATNLANNYTNTSGMNTAINTAVDGIEVGGRNLAIGTLDFSQLINASSWTIASSDTYSEMYFKPPATIGWWEQYLKTDTIPSVEDSESNFTVSCEIKSDNISTYTGINKIHLYIGFGIWRKAKTSTTWSRVGEVQNNLANLKKYSNLVNSKWAKVSFTAKLSYSSYDFVNYDYLYGVEFKVRNEDGSTSAQYPINVRKFKLEKGDKATDWTPAPEDTQAQIDTINKHLVIDEDSVDIVGEDGRVYASYGETASFYGSSSTFSINANGLSMIDNNTGDIFFNMYKSEDGVGFKYEHIARFGNTGTVPSVYNIPYNAKTITSFRISDSQGYYIATFNGSSNTAKILADGTKETSSLCTINTLVTPPVIMISGTSVLSALTGTVEIVVEGTLNAEAKFFFNGNEVDSIVEHNYDSTLGWCYEKWASGKLVQYIRTEYTGKLSTSQAGGYASASLSIEDYPVAFISNPVLTYGVYSSSDSAAFVTIYPSPTPTTGIGHYRLWRANSQGTSYTYNVCFEAKGRWF